MARNYSWTVEQENLALEHLALAGSLSAYQIAVEIELPIADTEQMLERLVNAEVVDMIPHYQIKPLVRAA